MARRELKLGENGQLRFLDLDPVPPAIQLLQPADGAVLTTARPEIRVAWSDAFSGLRLATARLLLDGADRTAQATVSAAGLQLTPGQPLPDGVHTIDVTIADSSANVGHAVFHFTTSTVQNDATPPAVAITAPADGSLLATGRPAIAAAYSDGGTGIDPASVRLTLDGADRTAEALVTPSASSWTPAAALGEGFHTVAVDVRDRAGNAGHAEVRFASDTTPPILAFSEPAQVVSGTLTPVISLSFVDPGSVAASTGLALRLDGADLLASCTVDATSASCVPPPLALGPHQATAEVSDAAGNRATAALTFEIADLRAPSLGLSFPEDGRIVNLPTILASGFVEDDLAIASVTVNGAAVAVVDGEFSTNVALSPGPNRIEAVATDLAGRASTAAAEVTLDTTPPVLDLEVPREGQPANAGSIRVAGSASDDLALDGVEVNGLRALVLGDRFEISLPVVDGANPILVRAIDRAGNTREANVTVVGVSLPAIAITAPADLSILAATNVDVAGTVEGGVASVSVNGIAAEITAGSFLARGVALIEGGNLLTATAAAVDGRVSTATVQVVRDLEAPHLSIDAPVAGAVLFEETIDVSGLVNDIVAGTVNAREATVTVNGRPAAVSNRSFLAKGVPLAPGENRIEVEAVDQGGNSARAAVTVLRGALSTPRLAVVSGDGQQGTTSSALSQPLVVRALDAGGQPLPNRGIVFTVEGNSGSFPGGRRMAAVTTDAGGLASIVFTLGARAGVQRVGAQSAGLTSTHFTLTSLPGEPALVVVDDGALQVGIVGRPLPRPLVAAVVDPGFNRLEGVPVQFLVTRGHGTFAGGASEVLVSTDSDGRAIAELTLDPDEGIANNAVEARIAGASGPPATFVSSGRAAGDPAATSISGIVLDNSNLPVPGATLRITGTTLSARTDAQGLFRIAGAPVGTVRLVVDGSTVERPGSWPDLEYVLTTIPGRDNTVNMPIFLLPLDLAHGVMIDETHGATITLAEFPGFSLEIAPGSVAFPGGSRSGVVSATVVHSDKVPMVPNFGQQPRFIVTIQPAGARFDLRPPRASQRRRPLSRNGHRVLFVRPRPRPFREHRPGDGERGRPPHRLQSRRRHPQGRLALWREPRYLVHLHQRRLPLRLGAGGAPQARRLDLRRGRERGVLFRKQLRRRDHPAGGRSALRAQRLGHAVDQCPGENRRQDPGSDSLDRLQMEA